MIINCEWIDIFIFYIIGCVEIIMLFLYNDLMRYLFLLFSFFYCSISERDVTCMTTAKPARTKVQNLGLIIAFIALIVVCLFPTPANLPTAGHRMIGILLFAIIIWMTEAVSYPVSATIITAIVALMLGFAPDVAAPTKMLGTGKALALGLSGYSTTAWALVAAAMFISVAMTKTGLDRRIALAVLSRVGTKTNNIYIGIIFTGFILAFFVPSSTARLACLVPIIIGIIENLGIDRHSTFAALMMVGAAQADTLWNIMIQTAAAQNLVAVGFISSQLQTNVSWISWIISAGPYSLVMVVIYYFLSKKILKPEFKELEGGDKHIARMKAEMGPMTGAEKKLLAISVLLLFFWSTGGHLHNIDTTTTTIVAVALFFMPGIGIMDWSYAQPKIGWGAIVMFGAGISLGTALLRTKAATWLANEAISLFGLSAAPIFLLVAVMGAFLILIHLGFASATALSSAMIPIVISVLQSLTSPGINAVGLTMIMQFFICFGFILPVNSPQGMVAYNSDTFSVNQFIRTGVPITIIGYIVALVFAATYWNWIGLM